MSWLEDTFKETPDLPKDEPALFFQVAELMAFCDDRPLEEVLKEMEDPFAGNYRKEKAPFIATAARLTGFRVKIGKPHGYLADDPEYVGLYLMDRHKDHNKMWNKYQELLDARDSGATGPVE